MLETVALKDHKTNFLNNPKIVSVKPTKNTRQNQQIYFK